MRKIVLAMTIILGLLPTGAVACMCAPPPPPPLGALAPPPKSIWENDREAFAKDKDVWFEGTLKRVTTLTGRPYTVEDTPLLAKNFPRQFGYVFDVTRSYRGNVGSEVTVWTGRGGGDCGIEDFRIGAAYLVDARTLPSGDLYTGICMGTELLKDAEGTWLRVLRGEAAVPDDLLTPEQYRKLHPQAARAAPVTQICGRLRHADGTAVPKDVQVTIWCLRPPPLIPMRDTTETKADGSYCTDPLYSGTYIVGANEDDSRNGTVYAGYAPNAMRSEQAARIEVADGQTVSNVNIALAPRLQYKISGTVMTSDGSPLPDGVKVGIEKVNLETGWLPDPADVGSDGAFELDAVPAGEYRLVAVYLPDDDEDRSMEEWSLGVKEITVVGNTGGVGLVLPHKSSGQ